MPHLRPRHVLGPFQKVIAHSPIVGVFGHRQVGKTTFLSAVSNDYVTLDDEDELARALAEAKKFIQELKGQRSAIDECQLAPPLFAALKLRVQKQKRPGQFILSGSVRFTSRKAIRESLTGRIAQLELFPLLLSEIEALPLTRTVPDIMESSHFASAVERQFMGSVEQKRFSKAVELYLERGGMPGVCFVREEATREKLMQDILTTILDRDLRLVHETKIALRVLERICRVLAEQPLKIWKLSELRKMTGVSERSLASLINAFESVYLLRRLRVEGGTASNELYFFEDQLEQRYLSSGKRDFLSDYTGLIYRNVRGQFEYNLFSEAEFFHYRTRAGAQVPLAVRRKGKVLGFLPLAEGENPSRAQKASMDSFLKTYNDAKVLVLEKNGSAVTMISPRIVQMPLERIF